MNSNKLVLLIEDNVDDERLTLRTLRKHNVMNEVVVAGDGVFALDYLFRRKEHERHRDTELPALIILDVQLPGMDGIEVLRQIRGTESTKLIPVVVMTTSSDPSKIAAAYDAGANSFVAKPTAPEEFSEAVLSTVMYWLLLNNTV